MLSVNLLCVGRMKEKFYVDAADEYQRRLSRFCRLTVTELPEETLPDRPSRAQIDAALGREAERIRARVPKGSVTVALCVEGKMLTSEALAERIRTWCVDDVSRLTFLIGGSFGLDENLKSETDLRLSLSSMTFPHHLARVMLLEQIYRAFQINGGTPYHK